jgi:hypothetical protein
VYYVGAEADGARLRALLGDQFIQLASTFEEAANLKFPLLF